jgi:hypothetical protein
MTATMESLDSTAILEREAKSERPRMQVDAVNDKAQRRLVQFAQLTGLPAGLTGNPAEWNTCGR